MFTAAALLFALAPQGPGSITINEFLYDHRSDDVDEFIELFNSGCTTVDIGDWVIDCEDDGYPMSSNLDITIPTGTMLAPGAFYLIANSAAADPALTSPDLAVTPPMGQFLLENSGFNNSGQIDSIILRDSLGNAVDAVAYESWRLLSPFVTPSYVADPEQIEGAGIIGENWGPLHPTRLHSWSRKRDGYDTDDNGRDFHMRLMTPGATNLPAVNVNTTIYISDVDAFGQADGTDLPDWSGSFGNPVIRDYATAGVPASPADGTVSGTNLLQFGQLGSGGGIGNHTWLESVPSAAVIIEMYVYFETALTNAGSGEYWHLGFGGTAGTWFNMPAPFWNGSFNDTADITGAGLTFVVDDTGATLYLADYGNGLTPTVVASMAAPSGWQRVRLEVSSNTIEARIGGTPFVMDGTVMTGALSESRTFGGVMIGHRRQGDIGRTASPFYADSVFIQGFGEGRGYPTEGSAGTPRIALSGVPYVGNTALQLEASGLVPSSSYFTLYGFGIAGGPIDVSSVLVGGVPPCLTLAVGTNAFGAIGVTDGAGAGTFPMFTPAANLIGVTLWGQIMQTDLALGFPIPLSASDALRITFRAF